MGGNEIPKHHVCPLYGAQEAETSVVSPPRKARKANTTISFFILSVLQNCYGPHCLTTRSARNPVSVGKNGLLGTNEEAGEHGLV